MRASWTTFFPKLTRFKAVPTNDCFLPFLTNYQNINVRPHLVHHFVGHIAKKLYYQGVIQYTDDIKYQIERILHWEPSSHWQLRDFVQLSEHIRLRTEYHIDAYALQTFWQSSTVASPIVLDALACFADYASWNDFLERNSYGAVDDDETVTTRMPIREIPQRWVILICWVSVLASVLIGILLLWKQ